MRKASLTRHFVVNSLGALAPILISLLTVPIYLDFMGSGRYGVLSIVWLLLGYLGFLDLGLSRAAANELARLDAAPQADRAQILVTALVTNFLLGVVGSGLILVAGRMTLDHALVMPPDIRQEAHHGLIWMAVLFPFILAGGVGVGALESRERFAIANLVQVVGGLVGQVVPALLIWAWRPSLEIAIPAAVIARAATILTILFVVVRLEGPLRISQFASRKVSGLLRYGGWVTVSSIISPILNSIDQFVIGSMVGVAAIAYYSVPMTLILRSQVFPAALSRTLFPRLSSVTSEHSQLLAQRAFELVVFGYAAICAPAIILAPLFLSWWLGGDFAITAAPIAIILFIGAWFNAAAFIPYCLLEARGRPEVPGKFHALEMIPFIGLLWFLTSLFGIVGAATAWTLRCIIDAILLLHAAKMQKRSILHALMPMMLIFMTGGLSWFWDRTFAETAIAALLSGGIAIALAFISIDDFRSMLLRASRFAQL